MKIVRLNQEARQSIKNGVDKVADAVKLTIGPAGANALIGRPYQTPLLTNDGITVAREIELEDEIEQIAKESVDDALQSANSEAGDGTTTTTILLQSIVNKAFVLLEPKNKFDTKQTNPMAVRKLIKEETEKAIELLKKQAKPIKNLKNLEKVATISIENEVIGKGIAKMFNELGKDAIIQTVDSPIPEITFDSIKGLTISSGLLSPNFENSRNRYETSNPLVLVTNHIITSPAQVTGFVSDRPLIIIADSISKEFIADCLSTVGTENEVIPVKVPVFNDSEILKDYAIQLKAKFIDREKDKLEDAQLGTAEKVVILKDKTVFIGVTGDSSQRIQELKEQKPDSEYDKEQIKQRIQRLSGGVGIIKIGAESKSDKEYIKLKIEDAINATRSALEEGYVKGGGLALKEVAEKMKDSILYETLMSPYNQIQLNAGGELEIGDDVIDPIKVTRTALLKASNVASTIITTSIAIADKREPKKDKTFDE